MIGWNDHIKLIVSDVDDTIAEVYKEVSGEMVNELELLMSEGRILFLISGQSLSNIYSRILRHINRKFLHQILVGHCNGAEVFGFEPSGHMIPEPFFSINNILNRKVNHIEWRNIIRQILNEFNLKAFPVMDIDRFKVLTKNDRHCIMLDDRNVQISIDFINGLEMNNFSADIRIPIIKRAGELFGCADLSVEPHLAGMCAIDFSIKGVTKGLPLTRLISSGEKYQIELPERIIFSDHREIEIWGDNFSVSKDGADCYMSLALPKESRSISFRNLSPDDMPENYNLMVWDGEYRLHEGLLEYLQRRGKVNEVYKKSRCEEKR
jgi:hydroxymethylpyrimidine pyrophosphatase-like HAD family hydrolase